MSLSGELGDALAGLLRRLGGREPSVPRATLRLPYPVAVRRRKDEGQSPPLGGGLGSFDTPEALAINHARLMHLASLDLSVDGKTVLDVGCGVGHLAKFFLERGCKVVCTDGREKNIQTLRSRFPGLSAHVANVEVDPLARFGTFAIVLCYGILYHLENPLAALRNISSVCQELLLLETMVCDSPMPLLRLEEESAASNQALRGLGCRPSPSYVALALERCGFPHVHAAAILPSHRDFQFEWLANLDWWRDGHPLRCVFIASRMPLDNSHLVDLISE